MGRRSVPVLAQNRPHAPAKTLHAMTDAELAAVCWVRAVEQGGGAGGAWSDDDAAAASREARRAVGEGGERAKADAFIVKRAMLAQRRLAGRDAAWRAPLQGDGGPRAWRWLLLLLAAALAALIVGNVLGASRINLLAPPVLGLLAWNLAVYVLLPVTAGRGPSAWLARALDEARTRLAPRGVAAPLLAARARFAAEWAVATRGVQQQRVAATMHFAAAWLALLVIASMYVFGLAFDYRAGWDSTWLDAEQVQRTLAFVFAPATALSGIGVPDIDAIAKLRFADGSAGERAARWIHLYAITLALVVVFPRLLLGAAAAWRAQRTAARRTLPLDEPYFRALLRDGPALPRPVTVLPYSYTLSAPQVRALPKALADAIGPGAQAQVKPTLPLGAEDALPASALEDAAGDVAALFAATATPERETHGAFVRVLASALAGKATLSVLVDESAFRQRGSAASDAELRLTQRRAAWQRMLHDLALPAPRFIDLS
jgi:Protein of unknown function (DUF2868)